MLMKNITRLSLWLAVSSLPFGALAGSAAAAQEHECIWKGTVTAVNPQNRTVTAKGWLTTKTFNLGANCGIAVVDKPEAAATDLRPGDKVRIQYQASEGVLVADRIDEEAPLITGTVESVDPKAGALTLAAAPLHRLRLEHRVFHTAGDCKIVLWNGKSGTLADVRPGDRVTVVYDVPDSMPTAYRINDGSLIFTGKLEAADLSERTVRVSEKTFSLADGCRIVTRGQDNAPMAALRLGHDYTFTFHELNGVNVADRVTFSPDDKTAPEGLKAAPGMYGANN
jgi:hypothetical protein